VALEIHENVAQTMSAIKYRVELALDQIVHDKPGEGAKLLEPVASLIQQAIEEIRRIKNELRPSILDDFGILETISWCCREFEMKRSGIGIEKNIDIEESDVPDSLKIVIFRVLQEAFNNIMKHTQADIVHLSLEKADGNLRLTIQDNGKGFDVDRVPFEDQSDRGLGLASMKERTEQSRGYFSIESHKGVGTTIRASWEC